MRAIFDIVCRRYAGHELDADVRVGLRARLSMGSPETGERGTHFAVGEK
jgi:hypothetical protein